jgi:hypothetical protein
MTWWMIAGALAVLAAAAAGIGWFVLRGRSSTIGSPEDAAQAVETALAGFVTAGAVVGAGGAAALAVDGTGRVAVCKRQGSRIAVREVAWSAVRATGAGVLVDTGERRFGTVIVEGVNALDIRRLAPHLTRA